MDYTNPLVLSGILASFLQVVKPLGIPNKYLPTTAVVLGIVIAFAAGLGATILITIFTGLSIGLGAIGAYDLVGKPIAKKIVAKKNEG